MNIKLTVLGISVIASLGFLGGCGKKDSETNVPNTGSTVSAETNSFKEVTSKLDAGGNLYVYLSTEEWVSGLSGKVEEWRELLSDAPIKADERAKVDRGFTVVKNLVRNSGVEDISGFGMSSIATEPGYYRSKSVLHHYPGKGTGFLWSMFGKTPHTLDGLELLPATTGFAMISDIDLQLLWSELEKEIGTIPEARKELVTFRAEFEKNMGFKLDEMLASLGGEYGVIVTLDEARKVSFPSNGGKAIQFPEPGIALVVKVKNDMVFDKIDQKLEDAGNVIKVDREGLKMRTMPVPLPLPFQLRPTVARSGDYLFVATSDTLVEEILAVKSGKKAGLKTTDEFKKLSAGMPEKGNHISFISERFGRAVTELQMQAMQSSSKGSVSDEKARALVNKMLGMGNPTTSYGVGANTEEGWLMIGNGNQNPARVALLPAVAVPALLAAIAIPNFVKARNTAQNNSCVNNLRMIDAAKEQWALENRKDGSSLPTKSELAVYLRGQAFPKCPQNGTYAVRSVDDKPTCTVTGHSLPH